MTDNETALVTSPAKALSQNFKKPRAFPVRLGIGVGRAIADAHRKINLDLWGEFGDDSNSTPTGIVLAVLGSIGTTLFTAIGCGIGSLITGLAFSQIAFTWPALIIAFLPAEFVACNILINMVLALPRAAKGIANGIKDACKFIKEQVEIRIPDE
jgi:hypothetical protein